MNEIVPSVSIEDMLNKRNAILERLETMRAMHAEINLLAGQYFTAYGNGTADYFINGYDRASSTRLYDQQNGKPVGMDAAKQRVDKAGWRHLLHASGMRTLMNADMRDKWDNLLSDDREAVPVLTRGTIEATFKGLHADSQGIFEQGVLDVFKKLSWEYKTNLPQKFGKRVVVGQVRQYGKYSASSKLDDLGRVFFIMDGKPVQDHRSSDGDMLRLMANRKFSGDHDFEYYSVRWFKNNNAHITFKRPDLVDQLNRIIAKHYPNALPAPK